MQEFEFRAPRNTVKGVNREWLMTLSLLYKNPSARGVGAPKADCVEESHWFPNTRNRYPD